MPDFDPKKFLAETAPSPSGSSFDPKKFLAETTPVAAPPSHEESPGLWDTAKSDVKGLGNMLGNAWDGAVNAVSHPIDTMGEIANSLGGIDAEGIARVGRNIPIAGPALDSITGSMHALGALAQGGGPDEAQQAVDEHNQALQQADAAHAKEHPLTDFIQRSAGLVNMPQGAIPQVGMLATDAFSRAMETGKHASDALKDAAHVAALAGSALAAGKLISAAPGFVGGKLANVAGVTDDAMAYYPENAEMVNAVGKEAPPPVTRHDQFFGVSAETEPPLMPTPHDEAVAQQFAGHQDTDLAKDWGKIGAGAGATTVGLVSHSGPAAVAGGIAGHALGHVAGKLVDAYGGPAVKAVLDAGIQLDKIADSPYIRPLMEAAQKGPKELAIAHYMLSQTSPEYQGLTNGQK